MKLRCCIIAATALLISAPAMAQQWTVGGNTNLWSSAQGTADAYGNAAAFGVSGAGAVATIGQGTGGPGGFLSGTNLSAITTSNAGATSYGGYAQAQTSGYAGGSISAFIAKSH
jgi:hypothetical protein